MRANTRYNILSRRVLGIVLLGLLLGPAASFGDRVTLQATLILASNDPAPMDHRLERVEYKLRRIFGFEYYTQYGEGSATVTVPADAVIQLGHGYRLAIRVKKGGKNKFRAQVRWLKGEKNLLSTSVAMKKGVPTVLGGPPHKGGNLIVTLVAK